MIAIVACPIDYTAPGPLTSLAGVTPQALEPVPGDPAGICRPVHALVIQPHDASALGPPARRLAENQLRPAVALIGALLVRAPGAD